MARMAIVTLEMLEEAEVELGDVFAENAHFQQVAANLERWMHHEIARRDAEYAAQEAERLDQESE